MIDDVVTIETENGSVRAREILNGDIPCLGSLEEGEYVNGIAAVIAKNAEKLEVLSGFRPGEVLVTQMTDPSMEKEMAKALAFVTDNGGETCHAAIIAKSLDKLCIVSTQDATKKIKTGDRVYLGYGFVNDKEGEHYVGRIYVEDVHCST